MKNILLILMQIIAVNTFAQLQPVGSGVFTWNNLPVKKEAQRESRKLAEGTTAEFEYFEIHATTQMKGATPGPVHTQKNLEELIIIKEGTMKCTIGNKTATLGKGSVLLIPPLQSQLFENTGDGPLTYYVLMFRSRKPMNMQRSDSAGGALLLTMIHWRIPKRITKATENILTAPRPCVLIMKCTSLILNKKAPAMQATSMQIQRSYW